MPHLHLVELSVGAKQGLAPTNLGIWPLPSQVLSSTPQTQPVSLSLSLLNGYP